jgi:hypothetical protein
MLKLTAKKKDWTIWTGFIWLRIGTPVNTLLGLWGPYNELGLRN